MVPSFSKWLYLSSDIVDTIRYFPSVSGDCRCFWYRACQSHAVHIPYEISFGLLPRYRELFFLRILRCRNIPVQIHTIRLLGQPVLPYRYQKAETGGFLVHFNICPYKCQTSFSLVSGLFNGAVNYFTPDLKSLFTKNLYSFLKKYGILNLC